MQDNLQRYLNSLTNPRDQVTLRTILQPVYDRFSSQCFSSAGLAIKTAGSAIVKAGSAFYGIANGVLVNKASSTDMAALSGTVTAAKFNVFVFYIDSAGTLSSAMGTEGATLGAVVFPALPQKTAVIGFVVINPTGTGNFVGGTTALDDATVVPNAVYVNVDGPFDPTMVLGS
jgi:hypothetical protein